MSHRKLTEAEREQRRAAERERMKQAVAQLSVLMCDLDHFKAINDSRGHAFGDAVLKHCAYQIRKGIRSFDTAFRIGGEEFLMLLPGIGEAEAQQIGERIRRNLSATPFEGQPVSISLGLASGRGPRISTQPLIPDAALYRAKGAGRDRLVSASVAPPPAPTSASAAGETRRRARSPSRFPRTRARRACALQRAAGRAARFALGGCGSQRKTRTEVARPTTVQAARTATSWRLTNTPPAGAFSATAVV